MKKILALILAAVLITVPCTCAWASSDNLFIGEEGNPVQNGVWGYNEAIGAWGYATSELFTSVMAYIVNPYAGNAAQWFLFDANGVLLSGWFNINGTECYFNEKHDGSFGALIPGAKKSSGTASTNVELYSNDTGNASTDVMKTVSLAPVINAGGVATSGLEMSQNIVVRQDFAIGGGMSNGSQTAVRDGITGTVREADPHIIDEVIVVGYGTSRNSSAIRVRGTGSVNSSGNPLYVIDPVAVGSIGGIAP